MSDAAPTLSLVRLGTAGGEATGATDPVHVIFNLERRKSYTMTAATPGMSSPRAATSVATRMLETAYRMRFCSHLARIDPCPREWIPRRRIRIASIVDREIASSLRAGEHDARVALAELLFGANGETRSTFPPPRAPRRIK